MVAGLVEPPGAAIGQQARLLEFDPGFGDPALHSIVLNNGPPECGAFRRPRHHQFDQKLAQPDRAHAMMNARRAETDLGDLETLPLLADQVRSGNTDIVEGEFADWGGVILT